MSLNQVVSQVPKPWLNIRCNNLQVDKDLSLPATIPFTANLFPVLGGTLNNVLIQVQATILKIADYYFLSISRFDLTAAQMNPTGNLNIDISAAPLIAAITPLAGNSSSFALATSTVTPSLFGAGKSRNGTGVQLFMPGVSGGQFTRPATGDMAFGSVNIILRF